MDNRAQGAVGKPHCEREVMATSLMASNHIPQLPSTVWQHITTLSGSWDTGVTFNIRDNILQGFFIYRFRVRSQNLSFTLGSSASSSGSCAVEASRNEWQKFSASKGTYTFPSGRILCDRVEIIYPLFDINGGIYQTHAESHEPGMQGTIYYGIQMKITINSITAAAPSGNFYVEIYGIK